MIPDFPNSPRDLQQHLDRAVPPGRQDLPPAPQEDDPLVEAARHLARAPHPALSDSAIDRIEARLMTEITNLERVERPLRSRHSSARIPRWLVYAAAACLVLVVLASGATYASADSLPGEPLYGVKRTVERVRLALAEESDEPGLRVEFAERRVDEFAALLSQDEVYPRALQEASDDLQRALDLAAKRAPNALEQRIINVAQEQETLSVQAQARAAERERAQLQRIAEESRAIQRAADPATPPEVPAEAPIILPTSRPTHTARPTRTPRPTATVTTAPPPSPTRIPRPAAPIVVPTRTPPGHGETPGLGDNPPGQGGENPGVGNDGQPPGQSEDQVPPVPPVDVPPPPGEPPPPLPLEPTRTPPGHGATPGLGDNPPGQGGESPGVGNDGQPPGLD